MENKIVVKGKDIGYKDGKTSIELLIPTPQEISKLKEGDIVLVRTLISAKTRKGFIFGAVEGIGINDEDIVAILPQPQQELYKSLIPQNCCLCGNPLQPPAEKKGIEELEYIPDNNDCIGEHEEIYNKLNEIIEHLNRKEKCSL